MPWIDPVAVRFLRSFVTPGIDPAAAIVTRLVGIVFARTFPLPGTQSETLPVIPRS
jgi:hypothetical protein